MKAMHHELRALDMNLLLIFEAIYRHRRVNTAASELAISPSALSHALARLRSALNDELFIREGSNMQPTARASAIAADISSALNTLSGSLRSSDVFRPESSSQTFRFAVTDYTAAVFFPALITELQRAAPGISISTVYSTGYDSFGDLSCGKVDFAVGFQTLGAVQQKHIDAIECFRDDYVVAVSDRHPRIQNGLTLEEFLAEGHVVVNPWNEARGAVDRELDKMNIHRRTVVELPSLLSAPVIVASSELIITLPERAITTLFKTEALTCFPVPFTVPPYILNVYFHNGRCTSPGHEWMKNMIREVVSSSDKK
ncbi:LysR family transcriptional regulator [Ewingella americana]|uniref:LysR family transcriptional regulator n=1 Tax=Ewingella americana TaxID=41202 RepID=UPI0012ADB5C4|nr:LysR family transcriptional regulator [Ewingella americana]MRT06031.1 LysR family transcriptional regulator [Ewingella americana]